MSAPGHTERPHGRRSSPSLLLLCAAALPLAGCFLLRPAPPPPPLPKQQVVDAIRAHSEGFQTVFDGDISLAVTTCADGKCKRLPTLGGVLAFDARTPALWLYAEKMTRSVFSLKAVGSRFWLLCYRTRELVTGTETAYAKLPQLIRPEEVRSYFAGPESLGLSWPTTQMAVEPDDYRFDVRVLGVLRRQVRVDRRRLVLAGIRRYDALGRLETEVRLDRYKPAGDRLFPRRFRLDRPLCGVTIELRLGDPEPNKPLPEATFAPPAASDWKLIDLDRQDASDVEFFGAD